MTTTDAPVTRVAPVATPHPRRRAALILVAALVVAIAANLIVAAAAVAAGAGAFPGLGVVAVVPSTIVGLGIATAGWALVRRMAHGSRLLQVLVPVFTVLSFTPDVLLLVTGFIPGATVTAVVGLMIMHLIVVATAVGALSRALPVRA